MSTHALIYFLSFLGIWIGSGLVIKSVEKLSRVIRASSFAISFFLLGFFTSISELSVGVSAIIQHDPEIYVGNLLGASIVLFILVIPLLAIGGHSIRVSPEFRGFNLPTSLLVIGLPVLFVLDGDVKISDAVIFLLAFLFLLINIERKKGVISNLKNFKAKNAHHLGSELLKIILGITIIFSSSYLAVNQTLYFAQLWRISPFLISLLVVAIGTNLPELSLVLRSIFRHNHQVAFGDYVGSAAVNTFLLGALTLAYGKTIYLSNSYVISLSFLVLALLVFYLFAKSKNTISRREGFLLLMIYFLFLLTEIWSH